MTPAEWIASIQTLVLLLTAAIVFWYTYETSRIRKETSRQNSLLGEQLGLLRMRLDREEQEQASMLLPRFNSAGGMLSGNKARLKFLNNGAPIYEVWILPEGDIKASLQKRGQIKSNGQFKIEVAWDDGSKPEELSFQVNFTDGADQRRSVRLRYQMQEGYVKQELLDPPEGSCKSA